MSATPLRVLYVGSWSRSGSTLLDLMLGQVPGFVSVGELRFLWQRGLIERQLAKGSKRVLEVKMTAAGRVALKACDKAATAVEAEIFSCFAPGELETYRGLMEKLLASMRRTAGGSEPPGD